MKILIAADMEGISGVVHWDHVSPGHAEYPRFRRIMTADVNAAVQGAFAGGAEEVIVTDGHEHARNILIEGLDPRVKLNSGTPSQLGMVQGMDEDVSGVVFVGYHAMVGTQYAILEHTWSSKRVANLWINGTPYGEIGLNAAVCGHFSAPVVMITGDQAACTEARTLLGDDLTTVAVKRASGRMAAECLSPEIAQQKIRTAAEKAVTRLAQGNAPPPLLPPTPIKLAIEFTASEMADQAAMLPGARRAGRRFEYTAEDMLTIYRTTIAAIGLAG